MPVDYSNFLSQVQGPDLGNTLARVAQIESLRNNNLLAHAQLDDVRKKQEFRNALSSGADPATLRGIDPEAAQSYQQGENTLATGAADVELKSNAVRQEKAQYLSGVLGTVQAAFQKSPEAGMAAAKYYWPEVKAKGFFQGGDPMPDDPVELKRIVDQFKEHADLAIKPVPAQPLPSSFQEAQLASRYPEYAAFLDKRDAAKGTKVSIGIDKGKVQTAGEVALAKLDAADFQGVRTAATAASEELANLDSIRANPAITGPTQDLKAAATAVFSDLGIPVAPARLAQVANLATYKSVVGEMVFSKLILAKGVATESDAQRAQETFAQTKSPRQANAFVIDYKAALLERKMEQADFAENYRNETGGLDGWQSAWRKYIGRTPLSLPNKSGQLWFVNDFTRRMQAEHPEMTREQILEEWRSLKR